LLPAFDQHITLHDRVNDIRTAQLRSNYNNQIKKIETKSL